MLKIVAGMVNCVSGVQDNGSILGALEVVVQEAWDTKGELG